MYLQAEHIAAEDFSVVFALCISSGFCSVALRT